MPQQFTDRNGKPIVLADEPFATAGGEGVVYEVLYPQDRDLVAKIYKTPEIAASRKEKIEFMQRNNPTNGEPERIKRAIIWIEDVVYKDGVFVGFTMQKVDKAIPLKSLTLPKNPSIKHGVIWKKFDHNEKGAHKNRLGVAYNLAQAVNAIHKRGNYVLVDMKPENIFVRENGTIAIIDLDSIQINDDSKKFPSKVFTAEYAPIEKQNDWVDPKDGDIEVSWDHFSLAVIVYELLLGIHPYQASHKEFTTRPELIKHAFYVHGDKKRRLHTIPKIHSNFKRLNPALQDLFNEAFERESINHHFRPSSARWAETILPLYNLPGLEKKQLKLVLQKPKKTVKKKQAQATPIEFFELPQTVYNTSPTNSKVVPVGARSLISKQDIKDQLAQLQVLAILASLMCIICWVLAWVQFIGLSDIHRIGGILMGILFLFVALKDAKANTPKKDKFFFIPFFFVTLVSSLIMVLLYRYLGTEMVFFIPIISLLIAKWLRKLFLRF